MTLAAATRLGPYEIVAPLGAGGMGEVYRARDTRLGRDVAVKVLPTEVAADPDRLRRFEQEARAASALNHPNLLTLFDVGRDGETSYLVTELLEGRSLRELLASGETIPTKRALDWGAQIARGLAAAHEKGIVHRDLKPENLFLTRDGVVKILDFGLAKLTTPDEKALAAATTIAGALTGTGMILGTAGYMAPEQVRGERVDARADLFALGCVLYELLGGRRAFHGESAIETLNAILKEEPLALGTLREAIPEGVTRAVERCLAKSPAERWQSARDLAYRLDELAGSAARGVSSVGPSLDTRPSRSPRRPKIWLPWAIAALAIAVAGTWLYRASAARSTTPTPILWQRVSFRRALPHRARFAPDGKTIFYSENVGGAGRIYSTRLDSPESSVLPIRQWAALWAISAQGQLALGIEGGAQNTLALASIAGGGVRPLLDNVLYADFSPDGKRLAIVHALKDRDVVEAPPGTIFFDPGGTTRLGELRFSPDGQRLAVAVREPVSNWESEILAVDLAGKSHSLTRGWPYIEGLAWNPVSGELWFSAQTAGRSGGLELHAVTLDGHERLALTVPGLVRVQDFLPDGRALLLHSLWPCTMVCKAPDSSREADLSWLDFSLVFDLSDDGRTVLLAEDGIAGGGTGAVYLRSTDGSDAVRLGEGEPSELSPDGKWALARPSPESPGLVLYPTAAGAPRTITLPEGKILAARFLPSSRELLVKAQSKDGGRPIYRLDLDSGKPMLVSARRLGMGPVSPDGGWVVVKGDDGWHLLSLDGKEALRPLPGLTDEDDPLRFDASGRELFVARGNVPVEIRRLEIASGRSTPIYRIGPELAGGINGLQGIALSADGKAYCYSYMRESADLYVVTGLR